MPDHSQLLSTTTLWLNRLSMILGVLIAIAYIYLALPTLLGLLLGVAAALSNAYIMWVTADNALEEVIDPEENPWVQWLFLLLASFALSFSAISVYLHTYGSIILLRPILIFAFPGLWLPIIGTIIAASFTLSVLFFSFIQLHRRWCLLQGVAPDAIKINSHFQAFTLHFSNFTHLLNAVIIVGHVWASAVSPLGLATGVLLSLCDLAVLLIFNYQLLAEPSSSMDDGLEQAREPQPATIYAYFIGCAVCILGSKTGSFIVHYMGTLLLGAALGFPLWFSLTAAVLVATVATVSGLLFTSMQAYSLWQKVTSSSRVETWNTVSEALNASDNTESSTALLSNDERGINDEPLFLLEHEFPLFVVGANSIFDGHDHNAYPIQTERVVGMSCDYF